MDTKLLHDKIKRFSDLVDQGKVNIKFASEMLSDFNTWIEGVENYIGELEFEKIEANNEILKKDIVIDTLKKIIVISGNGNVLVIGSITENETFLTAVDFLFENRDRSNIRNIYAIGKLLELANDDKKNIKNLVQLVSYARGEI